MLLPAPKVILIYRKKGAVQNHSAKEQEYLYDYYYYYYYFSITAKMGGRCWGERETELSLGKLNFRKGILGIFYLTDSLAQGKVGEVRVIPVEFGNTVK